MNYPIFEHRGVECWELEWHPSKGAIVVYGATYEYGLDVPGVEVVIPVPDLPERFADAVDAWCDKYGIEHPTTFEDVMRRKAPCSASVGEGSGHDQ